MNAIEDTRPSRGAIGLRLLYTVLYLVVFEVLKWVIQVAVLFQYVYLLISRSYSMPLMNFSNKAATYAYKVMRYVTLNDTIRPFPFSDFPNEMEKPDIPVKFD
ncbi:MAG: DUF4389 domain-containing protein [Syntrophobacteraceae bacterium]